jgi:rhodanese-related sulfurtransferase
MELTKVIMNPGTIIIDVREPFEFSRGHAAQAINIPLSELPALAKDLAGKKLPVVLYCHSGMRSANGVNFLRSQGINNIYDGGSLDYVNEILKQKEFGKAV